MELFRFKRDLPFMRYAWIFNLISIITFLAAVFFLSTKKLHLSVDFTGGTIVEIRSSVPLELDALRTHLTQGGSEVAVQNFGSSKEAILRFPAREKLSAQSAFVKLCDSPPTSAAPRSCTFQKTPIELTRGDQVGPQVGDELLQQGILAMVFVCTGIILYLAFRFEWRFAVAAVIANLHDVIIILGFFAMFQWEFSLPVLAGILAVLGYSVNESVVVADRIRENFFAFPKKSVSEIMDHAITSTMSRTIITHGCTQMMVTSMLIFGGTTLFYFALALTIGICFGIYSSVLVMAPLARWLGVSREHMIKGHRNKEKDWTTLLE
ncbi:MAG: protein translocase subunit SecF [Pseudomonadota bacterium]